MNTTKRVNNRTPCTLRAECVRLTGTGTNDLIKVINFSKEGMCLVSNKAMEIGSYKIIRLLDTSLKNNPEARRNIRTVGVVEIRWIKGIEDNNGSEYRTGVKFLFNP
jgi:hypothetical protein